MYRQEVMRYNVHNMLHAASYLRQKGKKCTACCMLPVIRCLNAQTACRLLSLCMLRLAVCMPHAAFCLSPCLSHVHFACCRLYATCYATTHCVLWTVCRNIAPYSVIFSNVRSKSCAVYSLANTTGCLLFDACCFLHAACRLRKIAAAAAAAVDICALV
jgi:hypothetical protein